MQKNLSVIVLSHNDELRIVDCLETVKFADEIIVVDDNSSDRTVELARQFTNHVFVKELKGNFANQRNYALSLAHGDWVLFVDSDELVSENLKREIISSIKNSMCDGYYVRRVDYMWGRKILHGEVGQLKLLRLAKRERGKWHGKVHERLEIRGGTSNLTHPLIHIPHQSVSEFIVDVNYYSTLRAMELHEKNVQVTWIKIILYPLAKFFKNYIIKKGYKDQIPGLLYAILMSFHSFLVRAKLYQLENE